MPKKKKALRKPKVKSDTSFTAFVEQPHIAAALLVFALIALMLSILEFSKALSQ